MAHSHHRSASAWPVSLISKLMPLVAWVSVAITHEITRFGLPLQAVLVGEGTPTKASIQEGRTCSPLKRKSLFCEGDSGAHSAKSAKSATAGVEARLEVAC